MMDIRIGYTHIKFFNNIINSFKKDSNGNIISGKLRIIIPSQIFISFKENGYYKREGSLAKQILDIIEGHTIKIIIDNYNKEFEINNKTALAIIDIDFSKNIDKIEFICMGHTEYVKSVYDCNFIGEYKKVIDILNKVKNINKLEHMRDHIINKKCISNYENKGYWFLRYADYQINTIGKKYYKLSDLDGNYKVGDKVESTIILPHKYGNYFNSYLSIGCEYKEFTENNVNPNGKNKEKYKKYPNKIYNKIPIGVQNDSICDSVYAKTEEEIDNWKYFIYNNKLPLFINICLTIDEHNNSKEYLPWIVDKRYTDEEIYKIFDINEEEQKLIDKTLEKFEKNSPWFIRYITGDKTYNND